MNTLSTPHTPISMACAITQTKRALTQRWQPWWVVLGLAVCATPWVGPTMALLGGVTVAMLTGHQLEANWRTAGRVLLQIGVVGLGFSLSLRDMVHVGFTGMMVTGVTVSLVFVMARVLGKWLGVDATAAMLIGGGTAICGGSAIAAMGAATKAPDHPMAVAMGTVFLLNAVALVLFPPVGHFLGLSPTMFGEWAGIAIHDISSVVGAAAAYHSDQAMITATTVKLSRSLWIIPVTLIAATLYERRQAALRSSDTTKADKPDAINAPKVKTAKLPWFLVAFMVASALRTIFPALSAVEPSAMWVAKLMFTGSLFLIGAGIDRHTLAKAGVRPIALGVLLWAMVASGSLLFLLR